MSDDNIPVIDTFFQLLSESKPEAVQVCKHSQTNPDPINGPSNRLCHRLVDTIYCSGSTLM